MPGNKWILGRGVSEGRRRLDKVWRKTGGTLEGEADQSEARIGPGGGVGKQKHDIAS